MIIDILIENGNNREKSALDIMKVFDSKVEQMHAKILKLKTKNE